MVEFKDIDDAKQWTPSPSWQQNFTKAIWFPFHSFFLFFPREEKNLSFCAFRILWYLLTRLQNIKLELLKRLNLLHLRRFLNTTFIQQHTAIYLFFTNNYFSFICPSSVGLYIYSSVTLSQYSSRFIYSPFVYAVRKTHSMFLIPFSFQQGLWSCFFLGLPSSVWLSWGGGGCLLASC